MKMRLGRGGWTQVEELGLPGPLYVRFRDIDGRMRVSEVYLDASQGSDFIDPGDLRDWLGVVEAVANEDDEYLRSGRDLPAPDLSTLASYYATGFGDLAAQAREGDWVALSFLAQFDEEVRADLGIPVKQVGHARRASNPRAFRGDSSYRLTTTNDEGLTDDFLRRVARAYSAALLRRERPNKAIADQVAQTIGAESFPVKTVQRWVYTARQRGIMPPAPKRGSAG